MKKTILTIFAVLGIFAILNAQDLKSKNGYVILPETGDYCLGFNAVPVLDFALNALDIMSNAGTTSQHPGYVTGFNQIIVGKYFLAPEKAARVRFGINNNSVSTKTYGDDPLVAVGTKPENILLQSSKVSTKNWFIGAGLEMRRGHNRLQGFYGGEVLVGINSTTTKNQYEIAYDVTSETAGYMVAGDSRVLSDKSGMALSLGLRGFIGIEYFVAPKISVGAEFGWGFGLVTSPRGKTETEYWDIVPYSTATTPSEYIEEVEGNSSGKTMGFSVDNGINNAFGSSAALTMHFHF